MPTVTAWIDEMRESFPNLVIERAAENGHEWGEKPGPAFPLTERLSPEKP